MWPSVWAAPPLSAVCCALPAKPSHAGPFTAGAGSVGNFSSGRGLEPQPARQTSATHAASNLVLTSTPALFQTLIPIAATNAAPSAARNQGVAPARYLGSR